MEGKKYKLRYLPLFERDLREAAEYIANVLDSPDAAMRLIDSAEKAILERLNCPEAFEKYNSAKKRKHPYYRIKVGNYIIFYVVIDDIMEVRRFIYGARDINKLLK